MICVLLLFIGTASRAAERPLNVVVFLADDLGATDLGCYGSSFYETPHLDGLAQSGTRLTAAYATCPVCSPTRASMVTGRYPQRARITDWISAGGGNQPENWTRDTRLLPAAYLDHLPHGELTIAEVLREAGYATFFAGKWHLGGRGYLPTSQGFQTNLGGYNAGSPRSYLSPYKNPYLQDGPPGEHLPLRLAEETCRFIDAHREGPFFAYLSFYSVHTPLQTTNALRKKYEAKAAKSETNGPAWGREREHNVRLVQNHPVYAGMVEAMDTAVGMVLKRLDALGLADQTIVIFTSDNGGLSTREGSPTSNMPLRAGKGWLYEGGIRVPALIRWPGMAKAGSTSDTPINSNDYFPTILDAAGTKASSQQRLDGTSLTPLLDGEQLADRPLFWHYPHYGNQGGRPGGAVRQDRWKLIEWYEDEPLELYDLEEDPGETRNLADERSEVTARLRKVLADWRDEVGAEMPTANPRFRPDRPQNK